MLDRTQDISYLKINPQACSQNIECFQGFLKHKGQSVIEPSVGTER